MKKRHRAEISANLAKAIAPPPRPSPRDRDARTLITAYREVASGPPEESTPVKMTTPAILAGGAKLDAGPPPMAPAAKLAPPAILAGVKGELRVPNSIVDGLQKMLDPSAFGVYLRLFRLSHGFRKDTCRVSVGKLAEAVNIGDRTVQRAISRLVSAGLIEIAGYELAGRARGLDVKVIVPGTPVKLAPPAILTGGANLAPNKEKLLKNNSLKARYAEVFKKFSANYRGKQWNEHERAAVFEQWVLRDGLGWDEDLAAETLGLKGGEGE